MRMLHPSMTMRARSACMDSTLMRRSTGYPPLLLPPPLRTAPPQLRRIFIQQETPAQSPLEKVPQQESNPGPGDTGECVFKPHAWSLQIWEATLRNHARGRKGLPSPPQSLKREGGGGGKHTHEAVPTPARARARAT
eukprot:Sspe_Gene.73191::Locus_44014_Transcript_1_1_Confidence_1.000_Length_1032::g.73191::m.73191